MLELADPVLISVLEEVPPAAVPESVPPELEPVEGTGVLLAFKPSLPFTPPLLPGPLVPMLLLSVPLLLELGAPAEVPPGPWLPFDWAMTVAPQASSPQSAEALLSFRKFFMFCSPELPGVPSAGAYTSPLPWV